MIRDLSSSTKPSSQKRSTFFKAAVSQRWQLNPDGQIYLPADDPSVVGAHFDWLYSSKIASGPDKPATEIDRTDIDAEYELLYQLYVFGEKILDDEFCNAVVNAIVARADEGHSGSTFYPGTRAIRLLYEGTGEGCPARKMMAHFYVQHAAENWIGEHSEVKENPEFLTDMCKEFLRKRFPMPVARQWAKREQWYK